MSIESKLADYLASPAGKKKVAEEKAKAFKSGLTFGQPSGQVTSKQIALEAAERMKGILLDHFADVNISGIHPEDIVIGSPRIDKDGNITVEINLNESAVQRDSLYPAEYPDGIENIVVHLTHGWDANGVVCGYWAKAGHSVQSRQHFEGNPFMQKAVEDFNALGYGKAELNKKYL